SWLEKAQGYYIASRNWRKLFEISLTVMESAGYLIFPSSPRISTEAFFEDPSQFPVKLFNLLNQKPVTSVNHASLAPNPFCISIGIACFVYCCHEFYNIVSGSKHALSPQSHESCIIPIWIRKVNAKPLPSFSHDPRASKKQRISFLLTEDSGRSHIEREEDGESDCSVAQDDHRGKNVMNVRNLLIDDDKPGSMEDRQFKEWQESFDSTKTSVNDATLYLERASSCWSNLKSMVERGGKKTDFLDQEFARLLDIWKLPLDISNAVKLTRADGELTSGNIQVAYTFYREIMSNISMAWGSHRRKESQKEHPTSSHSFIPQSSNDNTPDLACESTMKEQTPFILPFRVLYSISTLYRMIGWWTEARAELCMILATIPIITIDKRLSERDDWYIAKIRDDMISEKSYRLQGLKLAEMTKEGLVVRTIRELMTCFEKELDFAQDRQLDKTIGNIIVLMQFGWPYWRDRLRLVLLPKIKSRGGLKYPDMLRFLYNVEILSEMLDLYKKTPNIEFSFCLDNSLPASTSVSIKALENRISNSLACNIGKMAAEFFRERLKDEQININSNGVE
ncbi:348_t:CDS:2, partial [Acaulospora morrowiae]